jgi:hypothetical protein
MKSNLLSVVLTFIAIACDGTSVALTGSRELEGSWLLYETGSSPGYGYIIEQVDADPPQKITFKLNGSFTSSVNGWENIRFYHFSKDGHGDEIVSFFKTRPDDLHSTPRGDQKDYDVTFDNDGNLRLAFRYCYEGCHLKFRRAEAEN